MLLTAVLAATLSAGTIDLPPGPYCATTQTAGVYNGVTAGACSITPPGACPAGRQTSATVCYNYNLAPSTCMAADLTSFATLFQRNGPGKPLIDWPGYQEFVVIKTFDKTKYTALRIDVPLSGFPASQNGIITHGETFPGPLLDVAISTSCGDFNPPSTMCKATGVNGGSIAAKWKIPTATQTNGCVMTPGHSYYLNIKATHPEAPIAGCGGNSCPTTIVSNHTP